VAAKAAAAPAAVPSTLRRVTDVFVGGMLSMRSALVIGFVSFMAQVRAGREVTALPRLDI
jgi:hypothetical protein